MPRTEKNPSPRSLLFLLLALLLCPAPGIPGDARGETPPASAPAAPGREGTETLPATLHLAPRTIRIGFLFEHGVLALEGILPAGAQPALIIRGRNEEKRMSVRGRRAGLWMAVGTATFRNAPVFYQCLTAAPLAEITSGETAVREGLNLESIKEGLELEVSKEAEGEGDEEKWKEEFLKYEEDRGIYSVREGVLSVAPGPNGTERVEGEILIPARSPAGEYRVVLIGFKEGRPVARVEETFSVRLMGPVAFLYNLAMEHGWIYGIVAVLIALAAGLGVGAIIPSRGGH